MLPKTPYSPMISLYRLLAISTLLALIAVLAYFALPERKERILPDLADGYHLFFDGQKGGNTTAEWIDESQFSFRCIATDSGTEQSYCGLSINIGKSPSGKDFSKYQRMELKIHYQGDNGRLRMSTHNFDPADTRNDSRETLKGLDVSFMAKETDGVIEVHNVGWGAPKKSTSNVIDIGIDLVPPIAAGTHQIHVEYLDIYGDLLSAETWYLGVALLWLLGNLIFICRHLLTQEMRIRNDTRRLSTLANYSSDLKQESQKYKTLSNTDALTGALNRNGFANELNKDSPDGKLAADTAIVMIDIDHFKRINDTFGHDAGDAVLREVASTIRNNIRGSDKLIRWGGEEFMLFCKETGVPQAQLVAEKVRSSVENMTIVYRESTIPVTVSLGAAVTKIGEDFDELFLRSDQALYKAKRLGRNCVVIDG